MIRFLLLMLLPVFASVGAQAQTASAERGAELFQSECARCHVQADIEMRVTNDWLGRPASELHSEIMATMPAETPGSLSPDQYLDLTAYVLQMANATQIGDGLTLPQLASLNIERLEFRPPFMLVHG